MPCEVAVIGGGWSGLAAALFLAKKKIPVSLLEARRSLGGRAGGFQDNSPHLLLGAYTETFRWLNFLGVPLEEAFHHRPLRLPFYREVTDAPFYLSKRLFPAFPRDSARRLPGEASWRDYFFVLQWAWHSLIFPWHPQEMTVSAHLSDYPKMPTLFKTALGVLCLSALNTPPQQASASLFLSVLREVLGYPGRADLWIPRWPLAQIFPLPVKKFLHRTGNSFHFQTVVQALSGEEGCFQLHTTRGIYEAKQLILATPYEKTKKLLATLPLGEKIAPLWPEFTDSPITTVYLHYPPDIKLPEPLLGFLEEGEWVFDLGQVKGDAGHLAVVFSGKSPPENHRERWVQEIHAKLARYFEGIRAPPMSAQIRQERRATFLAVPHLQRPPVESGIPGVSLAGDYTDTGLPATLEGAIRSGVLAARTCLGGV